MKLYLTCFLIIFTKFANCQTAPLTVKQIDSIATVIDATPNFSTTIADGTVETYRKGIMQKIFKKKRTGSFSEYYYSDKKAGKLYKVSYAQVFNVFDSRTYYYEGDSLILVKTLKKASRDTDVIISSGQYYYQQGILIKKVGNDTSSKPTFLLKNGKKLLSDWQSFNDTKKSQLIKTNR